MPEDVQDTPRADGASFVQRGIRHGSIRDMAILRKAEANEARKMLLLQGRSRFGEPSPEAVAALDALTDVSRLEELGIRLLQVSSWQELGCAAR
jgi:hypothetical protein